MTKEVLPTALKDLISNAPDTELREKLIRRITWETGQGDHSAIKESIRRRVIGVGAQLFGVPPYEAERIVHHLFTHAIEAVRDRSDRRLDLTEFLELVQTDSTIRISRSELEQHRPVASGQVHLGGGVSESDMVDFAAEAPEGYALPSFDRMSQREQIVSDLIRRLNVRGILLINGSTGTGKSTLAALIARKEGEHWQRFDMRDWAAQRTSELLIRATLTDALGSRNVDYIIDDLSFAAHLSSYERPLAAFLHTVTGRGGRVILTTQGQLPSRLNLAFDLPEDSHFTAPWLTEEEVAEIAVAHGCPAGRKLQSWRRIIQISALGHPQLVHARVKNIAASGWPMPKIEDIVAQEDVANIRREVRQRLQAQLPSDDARTLAYRLDTFTLHFRREHALFIAQHPPALPNPGEVFDLLVGPWVEQVNSKYYRLSPLLRGSAAEVFEAGQVKNLHKTAAYSFLAGRTSISQFELNGALFHGIVGDEARPLDAIARNIDKIKDEDWSLIAAEIDWITYVALGRGDQLFKSNPFTSLMLRNLQFRVAAHTSPDNLALKVASSWEQELKSFDEFRETDGFLIARMAFQYFFNAIFFRVEVPLSITTIIRHTAKIVSLLNACKESAAAGNTLIKQALKVSPTGFDVIDDYVFIAAARCKSADDVAELLAALQEQEEAAALPIWEQLRVNDYVTTLSRTYRQSDSIDRSFGKGATNPYDMYVFGNTNTYGAIILPDGGQVRFDRIPDSIPAVYEHTATPTGFYKATMRQISGVGPNGAWEVKLKDGTIYQFGIKVLWGNIFGPQSSITGLSVIQDRHGNRLTIARDESFRMAKVTSPNGRWIEFTYNDTSKRIAQATDNVGRVVAYTYDAGGRLWKVTDAKGGITEYLYDSSDRMLTIKDARGIVYLTNEYDPTSGRITRQTLADTGVYQFAYTVDGSGKITQTDVTNPRGYVRRATFSSTGYTLTDTFALGTPQQQTYTYARQAGTNFILSVTDPLGRQTALEYDAMNNVTSVTRLAGTSEAVSATITYEPTYNQIDSVTDPLNHTVSFAYDTSGKLTSITDPLNHQTTFTYNSAGQVLTATDALQHTIQFAYDEGDLVSITDPLGRTFTRYVDAAGRVTQVTNPPGEVTRYEFDALNQSTRGIDPTQGATAFSYDPNGNLLSVTDARNSVTSYIYNNMDRVATRRDPLLHDETYQYDLNGNLTHITDRKSQVTQFTYDALDRLTQVTYADSSTMAYTYDAANRLTQVVDSLSSTMTYGYNNLDRLTSETTPQGSLSYTYDAGGRRTSMTVAGQATVNYTYDNGNRLTQITQGGSTVIIAYDDIGRRTSLTLPNGMVTEYAYDAASQLTSLTYKQGGSTLGDLTYQYDADGRRTRMGGSFARSITPQPLPSATYNAANQQLSFGGQTLTYDLNGNLVSDGASTYSWDARNRLVSISGPDVTATFQYDSGGRRSGKNVNDTSTNFLYDGANIVQEQSAQTGTANILSGGIDEIFKRTDSSGSWSPLLDGLGSSLSLTDSNGATQTQYSYSAFGQSASTGADNNNSAQYTGRENDGTGLQYNRARYYSSALQRFISEDPIGFAGGDINLYAYVGNDPTNLTDPSGEHPVLVGVAVVALILLYPKFANAPGPNDPIYDNNPQAEMVGDIPFMVAGGVVLNKAAGKLGGIFRRIPEGRTPANYPKPPGWTEEWKWRYPEGSPHNKPRWFDPNGGEWRWHPPDKWHPKGHWDHNPWSKWNSPWQNRYPLIGGMGFSGRKG